MRSNVFLSGALIVATAAFSAGSHAATITTLKNPSSKSIAQSGVTYVPTDYSVCANLSSAKVVDRYYYCSGAAGVLTASQVSVINALTYRDNPATSAIKVSDGWYEPSDYSGCKRFTSAIEHNGFYWCSTQVGSLSSTVISQLAALTPPPAPTPASYTVTTLKNPNSKSIAQSGVTYVPTDYSVCADLSSAKVVDRYYYCSGAAGVLTASQVSVINALTYRDNPATSAIKVSDGWYEPSDYSGCKRFTSAIEHNGLYWCSTQVGSLSSTVISQLAVPAPSPTPAPAPAPTPTPTSYSAKLEWTAPSTREGGAPLAASELKGYEIYYTSDDLAQAVTLPVSSATATSYSVSNLKAGTYHFAISAIDSNGLKSKLSTMVSATFGK